MLLVNLWISPYHVQSLIIGRFIIMVTELNYQALGARICDAREQARLTQEQLAEVCSLSAAHIGHIERGTRVPSLYTIFRIAVALQISIDVLLSDSYEDSNEALYDVENILKNTEKLKLKALVGATKELIAKIDDRI
jgi:transcriptional regulator with XRE-family HTH domain